MWSYYHDERFSFSMSPVLSSIPYSLLLQFEYDRTHAGKRQWARMAVAVEPLAWGDEDVAAELTSSSSSSASLGASGIRAGAKASSSGNSSTNSESDTSEREGVVMINIFSQAGKPLRCRVSDGSNAAGASDHSNGSNSGGSSQSGAKNSKASSSSSNDDAAAASALKLMPPAFADGVRDSLTAGLGRGPLMGYPLVGLRVTLLEDRCEIGPDTTAAAVKAAVARALEAALKSAGESSEHSFLRLA